MSDGFTTEKTEGGYLLSIGGRALVMLRGEEGHLKAEALPGALSEDKQKCYDECFAKTRMTTGDAKTCAKKCGLE